MSAAADARLYRRRKREHLSSGACVAGCGRRSLVGHPYCRRCGAARTVAQRRRLGRRPRSRSAPGRVSVYLLEGLR